MFMTTWDVTTDFLVIGSGGGALVGALRASALGKEVIVCEKSDKIGGSTGMSGGVIWIPNNLLMQREHVADSREAGLAYFESVVGDAGPASSMARRETYLDAGNEMVGFLESEGLEFRRCEGYSDYYSGVRGVVGGNARSRSFEAKAFDAAKLGALRERLRPGISGPLVMYTGEAPQLSALRTVRGFKVSTRVGLRTTAARLRGKKYLTNGAALVGRLLTALVARGVPVWTESALEDLVIENGAAVGAVIRKEGNEVRVRARGGVLIASGGFAHNKQMREEVAGGKPAGRPEWTNANPGDTGEGIRIAMQYGAATDLMDEAWWIPGWKKPDGSTSMSIGERCKPGSIIVDSKGSRYFNEAVAYQEAGQRMFAHEAEAGGAIPSWLIIDSRNRSHYTFGWFPPGKTPQDWIDKGLMMRGDTLEDLAGQCGIDPGGLAATVERFNGFARTGVDEDFHRGEGDHEKFQADPSHKPNPSLGPVSTAPFYAIAMYPSDLGTNGGLLTDEFGRVLSANGQPIPGLYATGNCTASVMGRKYLGAGATIGPSAVFGFVAANHSAALTETGAASAAPETAAPETALPETAPPETVAPETEAEES
jgi:3-oxosteroid 1-dehydrogenase